ncbi:hypothetical protein ANANG_G00273270 [Anguilla anguilla]|uniref:Rho-GAP domain-containing protein n=1 Tax=Anguilla anguilla TaxID=7936 RepID=A0A9D3LLG5_ANGAN|nr:hypothetical protein ANANG_G00273270 [Anguilla anguilla]
MPDPLLTKELYTAFINTMMLDHEEQQASIQLLISLLPPSNSDTLHRLLEFLSTVAAHADDAHDRDGQEITGNKMTALNLATIFGPNLLHKQKSSDKEFSVQSSARAEESTAIIAVVQRMISTYEALFLVPPELQNEVLMSLLETDPDVVDYLLRRKASQWSYEPGPDEAGGPAALGERHSSSDSNKASSGEVSPYDNNSPVLSDRLPQPHQGEGSPRVDRLFRVPEQYTLVGHVKGRTKDSPPAQWTGKDHADENTNIWGAWHATLKSGLKDQLHTGHTPVSRASSSPQDEAGRQPLQLSLDELPSRSDGQSASSSSEDLPQRAGLSVAPPYKPKPAQRNDGRPPPYPGPSRSALSAPAPSAHPPGSPAPPSHRRPLQDRESLHAPASAVDGKGPGSPEWQDWQRERWQIWQLLSSENTDTLPETLV